jgi:ATP-binding cassette subfamily B protein
VLVVAQRVSTVLDADQIIVLDGGSVVGAGSHHELLETCQTYVEIVQSQLTPEQAA